MLIPSIDIMGGRAVQLIGGKKLAIDAGDPIPIAERFSIAGELAVIDLDAALGQGNNEGIIMELVRRFPCRVGGGIRNRDAAVMWLDAGARRVIIGTAAEPDFLSRLPRERIVVALDSSNGEVVVKGWTEGTGRDVMERIAELNELVGGFLVTFVECEGRMTGMDMDGVGRVVRVAGDRRVTVAGGIANADEIAAVDKLGADVQVGMALYSGKMELADAIVAPMKSDRADGLWPTVVTDELGLALGLAWSNLDSVRQAVDRRRGVYHSRARGLWIKGEQSGNLQDLIRIDLDCDRDTLRFVVRQQGAGFCHTGSRTCWGEDWGLPQLIRRLKSRAQTAPHGSYTKSLLDDPDLLRAKLVEEAGELAEATEGEVAREAADLMYFALTAMTRAGVDLADVERELDLRSGRITRRPGEAKTNGGGR
jgi:phosphoribosyl-ATP pyrophosphohydrolase/phosphoribosyl-AMP cyclohydrolase